MSYKRLGSKAEELIFSAHQQHRGWVLPHKARSRVAGIMHRNLWLEVQVQIMPPKTGWSSSYKWDSEPNRHCGQQRAKKGCIYRCDDAKCQQHWNKETSGLVLEWSPNNWRACCFPSAELTQLLNVPTSVMHTFPSFVSFMDFYWILSDVHWFLLTLGPQFAFGHNHSSMTDRDYTTLGECTILDLLPL